MTKDTRITHFEARAIAGANPEMVELVLRNKGIDPTRVCGRTVELDGSMTIHERVPTPRIHEVIEQGGRVIRYFS